MLECYEFEECEYNGQPGCYLPDGVDCPHGVGAGANEGEHLMDIEKLIERLRHNNIENNCHDCALGYYAFDAATALSTLQAENEKLRAEVESLKKGHCAGCSIPAVKAEQIRDLTDAPKLRAELEQVKMECDAAKSMLEERIGVRGAEPITTAFGLPIDRLRELAKADREGRCVVLPEGGCEDKDGENALKSAMNTCFYHNNPVTRFIADAVAEKLTRQEAQAALRREQE